MDISFLRLIERIVGVLIGGLSIYLGYRLFLKIPEQRGGDGKVTLPWNITILLSRVGPGVFFAMFGAMVVGTSFVKGIETRDIKVFPDKPVESMQEEHRFAGASSPTRVAEQEARANARREIRKEIEILNNLPNYLQKDLPPQDRTLVKLAISRIKFALMKPVWGETDVGWGDPASFDKWRESEEADPPPALREAVKFFRLGQGG